MLQSNKGIYRDHTISAPTANFVDTNIDFGFNSIGLFLACDTGTLEYSINGTDVAGKLLAGEKRDMPFRVLSHIFLRGAGATYRLEVY